jgi:hypothetical protein
MGQEASEQDKWRSEKDMKHSEHDEASEQDKRLLNGISGVLNRI